MEIMAKSTTTTPVVINADVEKVPKEKLKNIPGITGYIVKEGDTLWNIAKRFIPLQTALWKPIILKMT